MVVVREGMVVVRAGMVAEAAGRESHCIYSGSKTRMRSAARL